MARKTNIRKDNVKFVHDYMNWGSPLNQIFVMQAINQFAEKVFQQQDQLREDMKDGFVHPEAWIKCALDWKKEYEENYKD
jgi:hypothetical protein